MPRLRVARLPGARLSSAVWRPLLLTAGASAGVAIILLAGPSASADTRTEPSASRPAVEAPLVGDDHPGLLERRYRDARDLAVQGVVGGALVADADGIVAIPGSQDPLRAGAPRSTPYAQTVLSGTDRVLTILVDFGPGDYADRTWNGPVHGQVPSAYGSEPTEVERRLFGAAPSSLRSYLLDQSRGRYAVDGTVSDWVGVPYNAARYGADECGAADCPERVAAFAADAVDAFVADFYARDPTGDLASYLEPYDQRDRYDADADGDFAEPDGYVDRLLLVFAGTGQTASGDTDLLRSQFGSIAGDEIGRTGPVANLAGGHELGSSGLWVDSFSAVPETAGLGTLVHTYGHDLGLTDLADPALDAAVDSSVQFWSPMGSGSRLGVAPQVSAVGGLMSGLDSTPPALRSPTPLLDNSPPDLLAAERLGLGWLDYIVPASAAEQTVQLVEDVRAAVTADATEAVVVPLGPLDRTTRVASPASGARAFVAAIGASDQAVLERPLVGDEERVVWRQLTDIEPLFDTVRVQAETTGGWRDIAPSGSGDSGWVTRSAPLPAGSTALRFVYATDAVNTGAGVVLDDIRVGTAAAEGAEDGIPAGWTATGWTASDGTVTSSAPGFYLAERRDLSGYDAPLQTAPYVADPHRGSTAVDHFGYDGGVLVTFWDARVADNAVSAHPGSGRLLVVDARPDLIETVSGAAAPVGLHPFDAAFGTTWLRGFAVDAYAVTVAGDIAAERVTVRAQPPAPTFDDRDPRYANGGPGQPHLPGRGVALTVTEEGALATTVRVTTPAQVTPRS